MNIILIILTKRTNQRWQIDETGSSTVRPGAPFHGAMSTLVGRINDRLMLIFASETMEQKMGVIVIFFLYIMFRSSIVFSLQNTEMVPVWKIITNLITGDIYKNPHVCKDELNFYTRTDILNKIGYRI